MSLKPENVTVIETIWGDVDAAIKIERSKEFCDTAELLSDYIRNLRLSTEKNDELIRLAVNMANAAEHSAYLQGFSFGFEIGQTPDEQEADFE